MKVLIVTYYWVPAGGSGVQRWLKFVKYLRNFNIEPVIYTVDEANYPIIDSSLEKDVPDSVELLKNSIWEPNDVLSRFKKKSTKTSAGFLNPNPTFFGKIMQYIRANYFIPDARKFWIKPSVNYLKNYLKNNSIDVVITTGPPHSLHLIGLQLKKDLNIKWVADFRDPWTDIDYFHQLPLTEKAKKKHFELEKEVLKEADASLVIGKTMKENYKEYSKNIHVVTNGYDTELDAVKGEEIVLDKSFSITHIGLMNADRNPKILWEALSELSEEYSDFKNDLEIKLIGKIASEVESSLKNYKFQNVTKISYVPHQEVQQYQRKSQVLLLAVNKVPSAKGIITGKIFEYLQAKRPILAIGPEDGDLAEILNKTQSGTIVNFEAKEKIKQVVLSLYQKYKQNDLRISSLGIEKYHRKELTKQLSVILKQVVSS
ncbi:MULTISPECIES: glycosyltransferase family 4 protein [unclassified Tenacibaculum]|uniref:glycosyltransferase family 4 protein n=1 Tax=unclassified Tenacibaculum TaxID=2635139 RepID=UPI001F3F32DF|nr:MULTISPECIES: glycosyltransferase family 4 protein [unclassified Tenacibaculum]MCF2876139.1 glycosyltransferase family 4 protein [Tenacibaculum sp. Cn5-1]MCF2936214.1 glycosyltransferase family 4 protein [Tenacibaculum sp. Cn5-34]MCG7511557.1 glycosyltransferase family 4 protein [Tenacibaculum sp. Cn5-46]